MSSHLNESKSRKHKHELPSKQNLHAINKNTKLLVIMALSTKYSNVISFAFAKRDMFMISKQNLHRSIKKLLNLADQILKVLFIQSHKKEIVWKRGPSNAGLHCLQSVGRPMRVYIVCKAWAVQCGFTLFAKRGPSNAGLHCKS